LQKALDSLLRGYVAVTGSPGYGALATWNRDFEVIEVLHQTEEREWTRLGRWRRRLEELSASSDEVRSNENQACESPRANGLHRMVFASDFVRFVLGPGARLRYNRESCALRFG